MQQEKWFNRSFDFANSSLLFPSIVERLCGTPARLEEKMAHIPPEVQDQRDGESWTIKENIGHLSDLEPLWQDRLQDILEGLTEMRPADLQNRKTHEAGHNTSPTAALLEQFRTLREGTVKRLLQLDQGALSKYAYHPRLKKTMSIADLFLFVAEHDDHHLARITELWRNSRQEVGQ
jgi:uncharacterized damage-inducible protein DinB